MERNYLRAPGEVELLPQVGAGLRRFRDLGLGLVVLTNQSGIARGHVDVQTLSDIHLRMSALLAEQEITLDGIYVCPHLPEDGCSCRKPKPGLATQAAGELGFDPALSFVVGDKACDIELARALGAWGLLVETGYGAQELRRGAANPDFVVKDLEEAAAIISMIFKTGDVGNQSGLCASAEEVVRARLVGSISAKQRLLEACQGQILAAAAILTEVLRNHQKVLLCGNGGSAADCQHVAGELVSVLRHDSPRPALAAIALTTDSSILTASANDFGFAGVFERQVQALGQPGDALVAISTSGNSENILRAARCARDRGLRVVALTGPAGALAELAEAAVRVPVASVQHIQECHITIGHILCELIELSLFPGRQ